MNFEDFSVMDFPAPNREIPGFVYVLFWLKGSEEVPFYVGQTSRIWGRMDDYYWAMFSASTDFRVGQAIRHLNDKGYRVIMKYKPSKERVVEETEILKTLRSEGRTLLNDLGGYNYQKAVESEEKQRIQKFLDIEVLPS